MMIPIKLERRDDLVRVVRCKDCKHAQKDTLFHTIYCNGKECTPDWYCADGERKGEE